MAMITSIGIMSFKSDVRMAFSVVQSAISQLLGGGSTLSIADLSSVRENQARCGEAKTK